MLDISSDLVSLQVSQVLIRVSPGGAAVCSPGRQPRDGRQTQIQAPEGRQRWPDALELGISLSPLRGWGSSGYLDPGLAPRARCLRPSGAQNLGGLRPEASLDIVKV